MPPRNRSTRRAAPNEVPTQPQPEASRTRGRVRRRGQVRRGGPGVVPEVEVPRARRGNPTLVQLAADVQNVQQVVQQIANRFGEQGQPQVEQNQVDSEHSQEVAQEEQPLVHPRVTEVSLTSFMKLSPPMFSGSDVQEDPQAFLDEVSWICKGLGCSSVRMVELAAFRLRDVARGWYETMTFARPAGSSSPEWDEFAQRFLAHFLPQSVRDSKAREFETLVQLDQMTVMEYNIQFMRLSRYDHIWLPLSKCESKDL